MTTPGPAAYRPFGVRLREAMATHGPLCAGVDPHRGLVESWGLAYDLSGLERFAMTCVEAFAGDVASVKPQSAFFEVFGARGVAVLERAVDAFTEAGTIVILDAKRGDIGSTMDAYAEAFLGKDAPSPADAVTVSPYLGYGSLRPAIDLAGHTGRGVFVLALTSNPEGPSVQHAQRDGISVANHRLGPGRPRHRPRGECSPDPGSWPGRAGGHPGRPQGGLRCRPAAGAAQCLPQHPGYRAGRERPACCRPRGIRTPRRDARVLIVVMGGHPEGWGMAIVRSEPLGALHRHRQHPKDEDTWPFPH